MCMKHHILSLESTGCACFLKYSVQADRSRIRLKKSIQFIFRISKKQEVTLPSEYFGQLEHNS